jgi:hypothetical protein
MDFVLDCFSSLFLLEIATFRKLAMLSSSRKNKQFWNLISYVGCSGVSQYPVVIQHSKLRNFRFYLMKETQLAIKLLHGFN